MRLFDRDKGIKMPGRVKQVASRRAFIVPYCRTLWNVLRSALTMKQREGESALREVLKIMAFWKEASCYVCFPWKVCSSVIVEGVSTGADVALGELS